MPFNASIGGSFGAGRGRFSSVIDDPFKASVVFYLNGDSLTDKTGRHVLTAVGSGGLSTASVSPVTGNRTTNRIIAINQSNSSDNRITVSNNLSDFRLNSDFTLEFWINSPVTGNNYCHLLNIGGQTDNGVFKTYVGTNTSPRPYPIYFYSSSGQGPSVPDNTLGVNQWNHIVFEKFGSASNVYKDGQLVSTSSTAYGPGNVPGSVGIGGPPFGTEGLLTYIDEIRMTRVAKYKGVNFTPRTKAYLP